jgi:hypothetical protein
MNDPPIPVALLDKVAWGELAEKYGNEGNDQVFHYTGQALKNPGESVMKFIYIHLPHSYQGG